MQELMMILNGFSSTLLDWHSRLAMIYLLSTLLIAYIIWRSRGATRPFFAWLFPREIYTHKSNLVDAKIFALNMMLQIGGVFTALAAAPVIAQLVLDSLPGGATPGSMAPLTWGTRALATLVIVLTLDFCTYWTHRLHHETGILWPFHAVHHSAEVMTPLTVHRKHPVYIVISMLIRGFILGSVQGVMLYLFVGEVDLLTIGSVNAGYFIFNIVGSNLRHSHIWLSYGMVLEHILISPAQHQIHHSSNVKHYNKNYGEVFAIWDMMFGTLYVPKSYEDLDYGLANAHGTKIEQPHPTLYAAMLHPFVESWEALWKGTSRDRAVKTARTPQSATITKTLVE